MAQTIDVLILGQGFAGSAVGLLLDDLNINYIVLADESEKSASRAAVGLLNPVTGRRMAKSWNWDVLFPETTEFYKKAYQKIFPDSNPLGSFLELFPIFKSLHSTEEMNHAMARSAWPEFASVLSMSETESNDLPHLFSHTKGWCRVDQGGKLNTGLFLDSARDFFKLKGVYSNEKFDQSKLIRENGVWIYDTIQAKNIVSCLGIGCPWVGKDLWPVKGQVLEISGLPNFGHRILKTEKFFLPNGNGTHLAGSTYEREFEDDQPNEAGLNDILADVKTEIRNNIQVVRSWAGIRPTTPDRRPIIRQISNGLFALNGLGTKGISTSPWAAKQLVQLIVDNNLIDNVEAECNDNFAS